MIETIYDMIYLLWGEWAFDAYPEIFEPLMNVVLPIFAILILYLTYKLWKYLLIGWWN